MDGPITRRSALAGGLAGAAVLYARPIPASWARWQRLPKRPFALGVASGDPHARGVVLWTRLATDPLGAEPLPHDRIRVRWEIARDRRFRRVVARGQAVADRAMAHSVHVEVDGLDPRREYFYRFVAGGWESPVGRTLTAPHPRDAQTVHFAFASCQHLEAGFFTAWRHLANEELDLILHLGDYIYEGGAGNPAKTVRQHAGAEIATLEDYRRRHAQYRSDPDLQAAHAQHPFVVTWDDHEVENNYAGLLPEKPAEGGDRFRARRAAAYQAYYEHMPLRRRQLPAGPDLRLYRRIAYGRLAQFTILDTRQYRSDQTCNGCADWPSVERQFLGADQERWVERTLARSRARWNVIGQQIPLTAIDSRADAKKPRALYQDGWAGYPAARQRFFAALQRSRARNPIAITGDVHSSWACEVNANPLDPASPPVLPEFIGTSIASGGDGAATGEHTAGILARNPQVKFYDGRRGYVRCRASPRAFDVDYRVVPFVSRPGAPVQSVARFRVQPGAAGVLPR